MIKKPERVTISETQEEILKKNYGYSRVSVYSPSFLEEYIEKIVNFFPDSERQDIARRNMSGIKTFIIGDRFNAGQGRLLCTRNAIHMEESLANITESSFSIAEGHEYLETIFIHELLHAASRTKEASSKYSSGVIEYDYDDKNRIIGRKNIGLNEGITQYLAEKISGQTVSDEIDSYAYNKKVVALLADVLGSDVITNSYFEQNDALKNMMNLIANSPQFYDKFNKKLDLINKLEVTVRRIKRGQITPEDPEALARLETVVEAQKDALIESVFANIVIPQIKKQDIKSRQNTLIGLSMKHSSVLRSVQKYIPNVQNTEVAFEDMSDKRLENIQAEIKELGIDFTKIQEATKNINETHELGPKIAKDLFEAVDSFYEENEAVLKVDHSSMLTPMLRSQLEGYVDKLNILEKYAITEEDKKNVEGFKEFLKAYFHKVPDLDLEIEKIRQKQGEKNNQTEEIIVDPNYQEKIQEILDDVSRLGHDAAVRDVHGKKQNQASNEEKEREKRKRNLTLEDDFVVDNVTGEILDQRDSSLYTRIMNKAQTTGDFDFKKEASVKAIAQSNSKEYINNFVANITTAKAMILKSQLGPNWKEVLAQSYNAGYQRGLETELTKAKNEGLVKREKNIETIKNGSKNANEIRPISIEEIEFVYENFNIQPQEDGHIKVVDKLTNQVITNKETLNKVIFANEWVNATGAIKKEDGKIEIKPELAFSKEAKEVYQFIQSQSNKDLKTEGAINIPELIANAQIMGQKFETVTNYLFRNSAVSDLVDAHFRMQISDAIKKTEPEKVDVDDAEKVAHH